MSAYLSGALLGADRGASSCSCSFGSVRGSIALNVGSNSFTDIWIWNLTSFILSIITAVFIAFPQPSYQGPSNVIWLDASQLEYLTTPGNKAPSSSSSTSSTKLRNRQDKAKIVELDENGDEIDQDKEERSEGKKTELDPSHYWIIAFNTTWSSPCRHFEAVLARCSIT